MSVLGAFDTAVSGMQAQSNALSNISQNISNSSTVGYKQVNTQFSDMVLTGAGTNLSDSLAGVQTKSLFDVTKSGQIQSTGSSTDIAINGGGFLVVNTSATASTGQYLATRAGSFRPDSSGNLVNAAGYYLQGIPVNADGTAMSSNSGSTIDSLSTVNISNVSSAASPTKGVTFSANLPSSETGYTGAAPADSTSTVNYYDALGTSHTLTMDFSPSTTANQWTLNIYDDKGTTPIDTVSLAFNPSGNDAGTLASASDSLGAYDSTTGIIALPVGGGTQTINLNIGAPNSTSGLTQFNGDYTTNKITQDGSSYGLLQNVSVSNNGQVVASFSNGSTRPIYQLKLANTPAPTAMTAVNGDAYAFSAAAGVPTLETPGQGFAGTTNGGSLEGSNVDITTQLTNLIETQRAYSSNATVIQTGSQMLQTVNQLVQG